MEEKDIIKEIKQIDNNVTDVIIPLLKDTIEDYRKVVFRLILVVILLIASVTGIAVYSQITISQQQDKFNTFSKDMLNKYNDFLSQFEFENEEYIYQDTDDSSVINSGINFNK